VPDEMVTQLTAVESRLAARQLSAVVGSQDDTVTALKDKVRNRHNLLLLLQIMTAHNNK